MVVVHTFAVADTPAFDCQTVADLDVAPAFAVPKRYVPTVDESIVAHESDGTVPFVGEIWPDYAVEDVFFDGVDGGGKGGDSFPPQGLLERSGVDGEPSDVVEMGVRDEIGGDKAPEDIGRISFCRFVRELEVGEWASDHA